MTIKCVTCIFPLECRLSFVFVLANDLPCRILYFCARMCRSFLVGSGWHLLFFFFLCVVEKALFLIVSFWVDEDVILVRRKKCGIKLSIIVLLFHSDCFFFVLMAQDWETEILRALGLAAPGNRYLNIKLSPR